MPTGNSLYQRKPGRLARDKEESRTLVEELKKLASEQGYTKKQIASELGVTLADVLPVVDRLHVNGQAIEKLKKFLVTNRAC
jgi:hypothetical protein